MLKDATPKIFAFLIVALLVVTTIGPHGLLHLREINNEAGMLARKNASLELQILEYKVKVKELKESQFALERMAREELGLSRTGETVYFFPENSSASHP
jgi:cell division protein FtsB